MAQESITLKGEDAKPLILMASRYYRFFIPAINKEEVKAKAQEFLARTPVKQV